MSKKRGFKEEDVGHGENLFIVLVRKRLSIVSYTWDNSS